MNKICAIVFLTSISLNVFGFDDGDSIQCSDLVNKDAISDKFQKIIESLSDLDMSDQIDFKTKLNKMNNDQVIEFVSQISKKCLATTSDNKNALSTIVKSNIQSSCDK